MSKYSNGSASVEIPALEITDVVAVYVDEITVEIAKEILGRAKKTDAFVDDTGKLRASGQRKKSKFNANEQIVQFTAPHAHLIEHGHLITKGQGYGGRMVGYVPPSPFLGPARDSVVADLPSIIARVIPPNIEVK